MLVLTVVPASPAQAALPTCTGTTYGELWNGAWSDIVPAAGGDYRCRLSRGNTGEGVRALQMNLNACFNATMLYAAPGHWWAWLAEDGQFGPKTEQALREVQWFLGISSDGIYGGDTRRAMSYWQEGHYINEWHFGVCGGLRYPM
jgi:hypothetical protein